MYSLTIPRIAVPADGHRDPVRQLKTLRRPPIYPNGAQAISPAAPSPPFRCPHAVHRWIRANVFVGGVDDPYDRDRGTKRDRDGEPVAAAPSVSGSLWTPTGHRSWWLTCAAAPSVSGSLTAPAGRRSWWLTCTTARLVSGSLGVPYGHQSWLPAFVLAGVLVEEALDGLPVDGLRGRRGVACAHRVRVPPCPLGGPGSSVPDSASVCPCSDRRPMGRSTHPRLKQRGHLIDSPPIVSSQRPMICPTPSHVEHFTHSRPGRGSSVGLRFLDSI